MFPCYQHQRTIKPENGQKVVAKAQVGLYQARGDYQLIVEALEPVGDGALLKAKLLAAGLFANKPYQKFLLVSALSPHPLAR